MNRKRTVLTVFALAALLLSGCAMRTVEEMYALPKRPEEHSQLQAAIDSVMVDLEYSAPISGEHQQTVQSADLDGDGMDEYLVFASGSWEKPLQVLIFRQETNGSCDLVDIIESNGAAFEQVEYVPFDDKPGMEIIIGCRVSDQVLRSVSVYSMENDRVQQLLLVGYSKFLARDLDENGSAELMVLRPGEEQEDNGVAVLYSAASGQIHRSKETELSAPSAHIQRIQSGMLENGDSAVFVSSAQDGREVLTDILIMNGSVLDCVTADGMENAELKQPKNFQVYPEDIDEDGVVELPALLSIRPVSVWNHDAEQSLLCWFSLDKEGQKTEKLYTFHNFLSGWYLTLDKAWAERISVVRGQDMFSFYIWNEDYSEAAELFSIYTYKGPAGEETGKDGRFLLYSTESVSYAAKLEASAPAYSITRDTLTESFRLIRPDRRTN